MRQMDIFGNEVSLKDLNQTEPRSIKRVFRKIYGFDHDHTCKDCKHLVCNERNRRYYKCEVMGISASEATDIHLKDVACGMWERKEE